MARWRTWLLIYSLFSIVFLVEIIERSGVQLSGRLESLIQSCSPIKDPPETDWLSQQYCTEGFKGGPQLGCHFVERHKNPNLEAVRPLVWIIYGKNVNRVFAYRLSQIYSWFILDYLNDSQWSDIRIEIRLEDLRKIKKKCSRGRHPSACQLDTGFVYHPLSERHHNISIEAPSYNPSVSYSVVMYGRFYGRVGALSRSPWCREAPASQRLPAL